MVRAVLVHMREQHPSYEDGEDIRQRTFEFACDVARFGQQLHEAGGVARLMVPQLIGCSTSIASMLQEARAAESDRDFISKCLIALKESNEAGIRARICEACQLGPPNEATRLRQEAEAIAKIIATIVRNKKRNMKARSAE